MRERPIIFTAESVRAILEGRKTQTRRLFRGDVELLEVNGADELIYRHRENCPGFCDYACNGAHSGRRTYSVGGRLWVRETFAKTSGNGHRTVYRADLGTDRWSRTVEVTSETRWTSPIHMPRRASRITLGVTRTRVQRLQAITTDDILAEGVAVPSVDYSVPDDPRNLERERECWARDAFAKGWDKLNAKRGASWASNPWLWVLDFKLVEVRSG